MPRALPSASVLHGGWVLASGDTPAAFAVWGEQSPNVRMRPRTPRRRPSAGDGRGLGFRGSPPPVVVPPHPFALSDDGVRHALSMMGLTRWATQTNVRHVFACLPSLPESEPPYGSPHRSTEAIEAAASLRLGQWVVPAVVLDEVATVSLLPRIAAASAANPGMLGEDLRAWIVAARFALSLLARQRFLPRLNTHEDDLVSRWSPVMDDPSDRATLRTIELSMPAASLALTWDADAARASAREALADYLAATIDRVARRARPQAGDLGPLPATVSAWVNALSREEAQVHLQGDGARDLRRQVGTWTDLTADPETADDAFRLCFRLVPPGLAAGAAQTDPLVEEPAGAAVAAGGAAAGGAAVALGAAAQVGAAAVVGAPSNDLNDKPWRLDYMLQATDDPSLLVPVEEVWRHRGQTARFLTRRFDQPQERVLAGLGRASRVFPPIEGSLRSARPESCALSTREAADLVRDKALLLKASGFGVLLPGLDTRLNVRLKLRAAREPDPSKIDGLGLLSFNSLVSYDWQLSLGDQPLTREEFEMLAQLKEPLVQLRGRWVDVRPDQIERALAFIQKHQSGQGMQLAEALSTALAPTTLDGVQVAAVEASGWIEALLEDVRQGTRVEIADEPPGFDGTLRPYQKRGVAWLATLQTYGLGALLADDMGLGKALSVETPVLTPMGWKPMGEMRVGDEVINSDGRTSHVTGVFPQGEKELYRVVFSDGTWVECCDEHLWYVRSAVRKLRGQPGRVLPLREFKDDLRDAAGNAKHYIPLVQPIEFTQRDLPIDPYLLGVLLGDGGLTDHTVSFSTADAEMLAAVRSLVPAGISPTPRARADGPRRPVDWRLSGVRPRANPVTVALRTLRPMGCGSSEKFIPDAFKFASVESRVALLQGLLDTDGCVRNSDNNIEYTTVSPRLAHDVAFIVQSLGGTARIRTKSASYVLNGERRACRLAYRMSVILPRAIQPFRLARKAAIYRGRPKYGPSRAIVDVIAVGRKAAQCITVDAPDGLYVTDHCIVTHNTAQLIALLLQQGSGPTLVICPTSVVGNWRHELARFAPGLRVLVHHGADRASGEELSQSVAQHDVVLSTYSLLHRDEASLTQVGWDGVVLDEAQNIKNATTRAAQAARAIGARWRVALTGTPVENRLADLWSIFQVINPGYLGSAEEFRREFALPIERASDADATQRLKSLTAPFILRRLKTDRSVIADLPDKLEMKVYCSLTREQATLYEAVLQDTMRQIAESDGMQRRGLVLALLTRLKQVCNHPALLLHDGSALHGRSGKLARLGEMLEEVIASEERALVFTQYAEMGRLLQDYLRQTLNREVLFLHGGTPMAERDRMVSEFQTDAHGPPVFLLSLKAGGTGLNLTRANHVFHFDRWWNPAVENQATDRAFRIGQTRNVQVHKYVCSGTFEETLDDLIERKVALAESIVGTSEAWITEMSTDDLQRMFRLRREDAVNED
jgi:SNF2 family DNA or RNA helicase